MIKSNKEDPNCNHFIINSRHLGLMRQKYRDSPAMAAPRLADNRTSLQSRGPEVTGVSDIGTIGR